MILGITFKENCPDVRNTKVVDIVSALKEYDTNISIYDPWASKKEVKHEYGLDITNELPSKKFDAVILTVAHNEFKTLKVSDLLTTNGIIYDVKGILNEKTDGRL